MEPKIVILTKVDVRRIIEYYETLFKLLQIVKKQLEKDGFYVNDNVLFEVVLPTLPELLKSVKEKR